MPDLTTNGHQLPPSTLAAQIVHSRSFFGRDEPGNQALFGRLLGEYLRDATTDLASSRTNAQLVNVVAEAGLDPLLNQSSPSSALVCQAIDSLRVIEAAIKKTPDIVFYSEVNGDSRRPALFLGLFAKFLALCSEECDHRVVSGIRDIISLSVERVARTPALSRKKQILENLICTTVDDGLEVLQAGLRSTTSPKLAAPLKLPSVSALSMLWSPVTHLVALPQGHQVHLQYLQQVCRILALLLSTFHQSSWRPLSTSLASSLVEKPVWLLDSMTQLVHVLLDAKERYHLMQADVLMTVCEVAQDIIELQISTPTSGRRFLTLLNLLSDIRDLADPQTPSKIQLLLAKSFLNLRFLREHVQDKEFANDAKRFAVSNSYVEIGPGFQDLERELQYALCLWSATKPATTASFQHIAGLRTDLAARGQACFPSHGLAQTYSRLRTTVPLSPKSNDGLNQRHRDKRPKLQDVNELGRQSYSERIRSLCKVFSLDSGTSSLTVFIGKDSNFFHSLDEREILRVLTDLRTLSCMRSGTLIDVTSSAHEEMSVCTLCDGNEPARDSSSKPDQDQNTEREERGLLALISGLLCNRPDETNPIPRKARALVADVIARTLKHMTNPEFFDLNDHLGQWIMKSLQSSSRECRLSSSRALMPYLSELLSPELLRSNRIVLLSFLRTLSERNTLHEQETLVLAWTLVGQTCGEDELVLILLQLVHYLGHTHALVSSSAFDAIGRLADHRRVTTSELFKPYWRAIATEIVRDLLQRPQKAQQLADLLGISVDEFLVLTQTYTVPHLVLAKRRDVLQRLASARGPSCSVREVLLQPPRNLAAILALLLMQPHADVEKSAASILKDFDLDPAENDLSALVRVEPIITACELLLAAGDNDDATQVQAINGLKVLAAIATRKHNSAKTTKSTRALTGFLEESILGIMATFTDTLDLSKKDYPIGERKSALNAIRQLIIVAEPLQLAIALPQIKATLQAALSSSRLTDSAFLAWATLLSKLGKEELEVLVDQSFAITAHYWEVFNAETQETAHSTIAWLLKTHNSMIRDRIGMIPKLPDTVLFQKANAEIKRLKSSIDPVVRLEAFGQRVKDENPIVVRQCLHELNQFLDEQQRILHESVMSQQPPASLGLLYRSLYDAIIRFKEGDPQILRLCARCIGILGSPDPNLLEAVRKRQDILVLSNFDEAPEVIDFVVAMLEAVLIKAFHSAPTGKTQTYVAYVMQELLRICGFHQTTAYRPRATQDDTAHKRWFEIPEATRLTLEPYFSSKYFVVNPAKPSNSRLFPIFNRSIGHGAWLRTIVFGLLHKAKGDNASLLFAVLSRVIFGHDLDISSFLLPFVIQNVILGGTMEEVDEISAELVMVLTSSLHSLEVSQVEADSIRRCSEDVFQVLDYLSKWSQQKKRAAREYAMSSSRHVPAGYDELGHVRQISSVERFFAGIPAETVANRALECGSYARAILNWENHIRNSTPDYEDENSYEMYIRLQDMYSKMEEPDAVEGLSARLKILDPEQQLLDHKRAGRWSAAQAWYEEDLARHPDDQNAQLEVMRCLTSAGKHDALMNFVDSLTRRQPEAIRLALPFAAESAWNSARWADYKRLLHLHPQTNMNDFNVSIAQVLLDLQDGAMQTFSQTVSELYLRLAQTFTPSGTESIAAAHNLTFKLHVVHEIESLGLSSPVLSEAGEMADALQRRLNILGSFIDDKQFLLGLRRAAMSFNENAQAQLSEAWLTTAALARESSSMTVAYNAVLYASRLNNHAAGVEHSKLLWSSGQHRQAIDNLKSVLESNAFQSFATLTSESLTTVGHPDQLKEQNQLMGETQLLLADWMNEAGLIKSSDLLPYYHSAQKSWNRSQDILYRIAKYYNKVYDAERGAPRAKQSSTFLTGECAKLAIENYLRSMVFGSKHYYETVPKMLTFWLDLGEEVHEASLRRLNNADAETATFKAKRLDAVHKQVRKYVERLPAYVFYGALPQMVSRISHRHPDVAGLLSFVMAKVIGAYPQQALWTILAVAKSRQTEKARRAEEIIADIKKVKTESTVDVKSLVLQGIRLTESLLQTCETTLDPRSGSRVSLSRDLHFNHKHAPCGLVVPVEKNLVATLPTGHGGAAVRTHRPFALKPITIVNFLDDVLVLNSLQKPRKVNVRGSDGQTYGLLCKPKDDLRKDQRLMEFNAMICRGLKWDAVSSKRRLYIRMYAVTPLNEECGAIEWVDGLKPMRDIILESYKAKNIKPNYSQLRELLDKACSRSDPNAHLIFTNEILPTFPPTLHEWFVNTFSEPSAWFAARLRYTRSCAVMSIVGHALGLGDRHGENILLEEGTGGVFHVDFNCLFDKGLTFEKPEMVPFRLTHNMVDAFGPYKHEGPFRIAAELTMKSLKQHEDTLMTILETFLHDPTTDFVGSKPKKKTVQGVPDTPREILESVRGKIRGYLPGENVPLSVDGYVDALIKMATSPMNLAAMYIGWCAFF